MTIALQSPGAKRSEQLVDQRDGVVLTPKNVQALRTLFNVAHRLCSMLGPSWVLVLETLAALDRAIHSPHATTQEVSSAVSKLARESSGQFSDFNILSSLNSQLFESSALMHVSAVKSLLSALRQLSHQSISGTFSSTGQASSQKTGNISFSVDRMISVLANNLHRIDPLWEEVVEHFLELADSSNPHLRNMGLDALDQSICAVLGSEQFQEYALSRPHGACDKMGNDLELKSLEHSVITPLRTLYFSTQRSDVRAGSLKILMHILERHGDKLHYSWPNILEMLRSVADASEKDIVTLGFQSLRAIMNDGLSTVPPDCLHVCIDVTGAYSAQKTELNISLTAIGLLWTSTDFIAKGLLDGLAGEDKGDQLEFSSSILVDHNQLLFSVFSILQNLGADERPEVRNSAVRTLFQTLGTHGQKLSSSMWEDCLWNYVFPTLDRASHMAATSSKDEWQGKELGTRGGKTVHMLIHHSRNTAQKQWDETLVLVLGGIARILRSFFPLLGHVHNFWSGWESLLHFLTTSILNGSKEVAFAAITCLQSTVLSHYPKGNLPMPYLKSILDVYELVLQHSTNSSSVSATKVKQEVVHGLGELYSHAKGMFDSSMYMQLLSAIDSAVREPKVSKGNYEAEFGHIPPVQRSVLEICPLLHPPEHLSSMWPLFLRKLLQFLPKSGPSNVGDASDESSEQHHVYETKKTGEVPNGSASTPPKILEPSSWTSGSLSNADPSITSYLFAEKLIPVLIDVFLQCPSGEKYSIFPDIVQGLGRCMTTRRDNPDAGLWRLAVEGFNRILVDDVRTLALPVPSLSRPSRIRMWKEIADVYEIFLVGYCGRALPSDSLTASSLEADESLEINILGVLGDNILKSLTDASAEILRRLITSLDRCASRTSSLPIETVELMPSHCSRFSFTCLQKLFSLSSYDSEAGKWNLTRAEVSKISISMLVARCESILNKFLSDENGLGERPMPSARQEEVALVLQESARLVIHWDTASVLPLNPALKGNLEDNHRTHSHLLVLFPSLCELVTSRESRVRELVQVLLRLISDELGLRRVV